MSKELKIWSAGAISLQTQIVNQYKFVFGGAKKRISESQLSNHTNFYYSNYNGKPFQSILDEIMSFGS